MSADNRRETFIRLVPADIWARARGHATAEDGDISGFFLLKRQGSQMVLWEVLKFAEGVTQTIRPIGPTIDRDYERLIQRNFECS